MIECDSYSRSHETGGGHYDACTPYTTCAHIRECAYKVCRQPEMRCALRQDSHVQTETETQRHTQGGREGEREAWNKRVCLRTRLTMSPLPSSSVMASSSCISHPLCPCTSHAFACCKHACTHAHMHTCTHARMHACTHTCTHAYTHAHMHTCTHARILAHTHTRKHTHLHAYTHPSTHATIPGTL